MMELVDVPHLGCGVERRVGSSPTERTFSIDNVFIGKCVYYEIQQRLIKTNN